MKKVLFVILIVILFVCSLGLFACSNNENLEQDSLSGTEILAPSFQVNDNDLYKKLPNSTTTFSFIDNISVAESSKFTVSTDINGINVIPTKTVSLNVGDNVFYILVTDINGNMKLYSVLLRVKPIYNVTFNTLGGSEILNQSVEEDSFATIPTIDPVKQGYTFKGWGFDFNTPITSDITITVNSWQANTYIVNFNGNGVDNPNNITVTYDELYGQLPILDRKDYTFIGWWTDAINGTEIKSNSTVQILKDTMLYARWQIKQCEVSIAQNYTGAGIVSGSGKYDYNSKVVVTATSTFLGYSFKGWYIDDDILTEELSYVFTASTEKVNLVAKYIVNKEMENFDFTSSDTTCLISGIKDKTVDNITVPAYVTAINEGAFSGCANLVNQNLSFVGGLSSATTASNSSLFGYVFGRNGYTGGTSIFQHYSNGLYSYYCIPDSLRNVTITGGNILYGAFNNCSLLESITITNGVTNIGEKAFQNCSSLTTINISKSVQNIGAYAFSYCTKLENMSIQDGLQNIGSYAFSNCKGLKNIVIPDSVQSIASSAFQDCTAIQSMTLPFVGGSASATVASSSTLFGYIFGDSANVDGQRKVQWYSGNSYVTYWIPNSLRNITITGGEIFYGAFYNCRLIEQIIIGNETKRIEDHAFSECNSLKNLLFGSGLDSIGYNVFSSCNNLQNIIVENGNLYYASENGILYNKGKTQIILVPKAISGSVILPTSLTNIDGYAFSYCKLLEKITIPSSITAISATAFSECELLNEVNYLGTIDQWVSIDFKGIYSNPLNNGANLYINNEKQTNIVINVDIGAYAFYNCLSLNNVTISNDVKNIGSYAFYGCDSLQYNEHEDALYLGNNTNLFLLLVKAKNTNITQCSIHNDTKFLHNLAFSGCSLLQNITFGSNLTYISDSAFSGCGALKNITIPNNIINIERNAFYNCSSLENLIISDGVTDIADYAFYGCSSLKSLELPSSVISIGAYTFSGCSSLKNIIIPNSVTSIGSSAFSSCNSLQYNVYDNGLYLGNSINPYIVLVKAKNTSITSCDIHENTKIIYYYSFWCCSSLTSVTIPQNVVYIGEYVFWSCNMLNSITVKDGNTKYSSENGILYDKNKTEIIYVPKAISGNVVLPTTLTSIPDYAFDGCNAIESIEIPSKVTTIGNFAFENCTSITNIIIPENVTRIGAYAFNGCSNMNSIDFLDITTWYKTSNSVYAYGTAMDVTNPTTNVISLRDVTIGYYWYKI